MFRFILTFLLASHIRSLQIDDFFPFGPSVGDSTLFKNDDLFVGPIKISVTFPFFSKAFDSLYVNTNGLISFDTGVRTFTPIPFPLRNITVVSPYWTDIDTRRGGDVYYREILNISSLNSLGYEIRRSFSSFYSFKPTWAFCVTWYQVANYNGTFDLNVSSPINNTFQAIVATNGLYSFTIYNYEKLMWPNQNITKLVQAGFNAGDGSTFYAINGSFTSNVVSLSNRSNVNTNGKFIFRVDKSNITSGGCSYGGYLTVIPKTFVFIGGGNITLRGPCFNPGDDVVQVNFDNTTSVDCLIVDSSSCTCQVPFLDRVGRIKIIMSVDSLTNGNTTTFTGYIDSRDFLNYGIKGLDELYTLNQTNKILNITLDPKYSNPNSSYQLYFSLIDSATKKTNLILLKNNLTDGFFILNLNQFFNATSISRRSIVEYLKAEGLIILKNIENAYDEVAQTIGIVSDAVFDEVCYSWHDSQPDPKPYLDSLPPCRPTISPDFPDTFLNFAKDKACNPENPGQCERFHKGAKGCYRSTSTGLEDSQQQCCYGPSGNLLVGPPGGGTLDKSSSDLSKLKHFKDDVVPYYYCCKFSNNCDKYYDKRPSDNGSRWRPPTPSGGRGDPHFLTHDQLSYTFNGYGEYVLFAIDSINFTVQVRIQPLGLTKATVLKGIAIKGNNIDKIQIELDNMNSTKLYVNDFVDELSETSFQISLNGLSIKGSELGYSLKYSNGIEINVELVSTHDAFYIVSIVPEDYKYKTKGLLGTYDGNQANDFTLPNGTLVQIDPTNDRDIFHKFGNFWKNTLNSTIFSYADGFSYMNYYNDSYVPFFLSDGLNTSNSSLFKLANETCQQNKLCLFDVMTTGQISIGVSTLEFEKKIQKLNQEFKASLDSLNGI